MATSKETVLHNRELVAGWFRTLDSDVDTTALQRRFWSLTTLDEADPATECIYWRNPPRAYPMFSIKGVNTYSHRVAARIGLPGYAAPQEIPDGMIVDHVADRGCTGMGCVNPAHLEVVNRITNSARRNGASSDKVFL